MMKNRLFYLLTLMLTMLTQGAWASIDLTKGDSADDPITIASAADWNDFCASFNDDRKMTYSGKFVKMTANIPTDEEMDAGTTAVTTFAAPTYGGNYFEGTFDGDGHALTVNISLTKATLAPFRYLKNATVKNLKVVGTVKGNGYKYRGGIAGVTYGNCTISDCTVRATIDFGTYKGSHESGGLVGYACGNVTLNNCVFWGKLLGSSATNVAGFVGKRDKTTNVITLNQCLFYPTEVNVGASGSATFVRSDDDTNITLTDCYATQFLGDVQGTLASQTAPAAGKGIYKSQVFEKYKGDNESTTLYVIATLSGVKDTYGSSDTGGTVTPVLTLGGTTLIEGTDYEVTSGSLTYQASGPYKVTLSGKGDYQGSQDISFTVTGHAMVTSETTTFEDGIIYHVASNVTIGERITVNGTAVLNLRDGYTLTAQKGIEVGEGKQLTINGETANTGKLIINRCDGEKAGIGAYHVGTIIINGGTLDVQGGSCAAGIGGSNHTINGGTITINGGIVNATGGDHGAGIGGGGNLNWIGNYGQCGTITINGGQVTATSGSYACGIGPGKAMGSLTSGSVTLGWTAETDFIKATGDGGFSSRIASLAFEDGKRFIVESLNQVATTDNIQKSCKLVPMTAEAEKNLYYFPVSNFEARYQFTGSDINVTPVMKDLDGNTLTKGTHYTTAITCNGVAAESVKAVGSYTYTFTATTTGGYTGSQSITFEVETMPAPTGLHQTAYAANSATLSWTKGDKVSQWKLQYDTDSNFSNPDEVTVSTTPTTTITGLTPEVDYYVRVKAVIGEVESNWSDVTICLSSDKKWIGIGQEADEECAQPINTYYNFSVSEQIYTAEEIGQAGRIMNIAFKMMPAESGQADVTRALDIYMVHTDKTEFGYEYDWIVPTEDDRVFSGDVTFTTGKWTTINLDKPFVFNGSQNLAIIVDDNTGDYDDENQDYEFLTMSGDDTKCIYFYDDDDNVDPTTDLEDYKADEIDNERNQILIGMTPALVLYDTADNTTAITDANSHVEDVVLSGRTLFKDGNWNTLCLPFAVSSFTGTPLEDATVMELDVAGKYNDQGKADESGTYQTGLDGTTLNLYFKTATSIVAGKPYIVKWASGDDLVNPVFTGVTVSDATNNASFTGGAFKGTYKKLEYTKENQSILFLGGNNTLYYPQPSDGYNPSIGAFRAYFQLGNGATARQFVLRFVEDPLTEGGNFGDGSADGSSASGITVVSPATDADGDVRAPGWYAVDGMRLDGKPTARGIYIHNGRKVVIK